jgi:hypothetical protein
MAPSETIRCVRPTTSPNDEAESGPTNEKFPTVVVEAAPVYSLSGVAPHRRPVHPNTCGLATNLVDKGVAMLQYTDDNILLIQDDLHQARNLKLLLYIFESMSGLKINFEKIEVMLILDDEIKAHCFAGLF